MIANHGITELTLGLRENRCSNKCKSDENLMKLGTKISCISVEVLLKLASECSSLCVIQYKVKSIDHISNSKYFFGLMDVEWAPVILEMFSRKLDKLWIRNFNYPHYLTPSCVDQLQTVS